MITMKIDPKKPLQFNVYECSDCQAKKKRHQIIDVPGPETTDRSCWGSGIPTTMRKCTGCGFKDGPWVSSEIVGGGW